MSDLIFSIPQETYFGVDILNRLAAVVLQYGERALIITEAILYERNTICLLYTSPSPRDS